MFLFSRPSEAQIERFLAQARESAFNYSERGASSGSIPGGYNVDHNRVRLGSGLQAWNRAVEAIKSWKMFELDWVVLYWRSTPILEGENVAVLARHWNCYSLNGCRIVYVVEENGPLRRFGFAYGTLHDHAESGEERFLLEWNDETGEVWYDLLAFSRPNQFFTRIGCPFARQLQKRFAAGSQTAMVRAVAQPGP